MTANPDEACPHPDFSALVEVYRLTAIEGGPVTGYSAEAQIECVACSERFVFIGLPMGLSPNRPCVDVPGTTLRAPIRPASSTAELDPASPGFAINVVDHDRAPWAECCDRTDPHEHFDRGPGPT